jgi:hypothetical protein
MNTINGLLWVFTVSNYIDYDDWNSLDSINLNSDNLPELQALKHANLEPGRAYRFRISGINACGRGEWSEVSKQLLIFCFEHFSTNNHFDKKKSIILYFDILRQHHSKHVYPVFLVPHQLSKFQSPQKGPIYLGSHHHLPKAIFWNIPFIWQ